MAGLEKLVCTTEKHIDEGELWIDGSFITEKTHPKDVDLVLRIDSDLYDNGTNEQRQIIDWIASNLRNELLCDSYIFFEYETTDPLFSFGKIMYSYWEKQFGFSRGGEVKGFAVYAIGSARNNYATRGLFFWWSKPNNCEHALTAPSARRPWA